MGSDSIALLFDLIRKSDDQRSKILVKLTKVEGTVDAHAKILLDIQTKLSKASWFGVKGLFYILGILLPWAYIGWLAFRTGN
jgi:hypothetical protein